MYVLEVKVKGSDSWECYQFPTTEKVLDYIYMVEGESYLAEYRNEFQRMAPSAMDIRDIRSTKAFCGWQVQDIRYYLSWTPTGDMAKHKRIKYNFPKLSKFWGTVYGVDSRADRVRVEKARSINSNDIHMGAN